MRSSTLILIALLSTWSFLLEGQTAVSIIGRNTGTMDLADGNKIRVFGFTQDIGENPNVPGPTIEVLEGDSVILDFWNISQGAPHTIHLHGLDVDQQNDGVPQLSFEVHHMEHGYYRFKAPHPGTYLYHCHVVSSIHVQAGMYGSLIVRPQSDSNITWEGGYSYQSEANIILSEIDTFWHHDSVLLHDYDTATGNHVISLPKYEPQHFLVNGKSEQQLDDLVIKGQANSAIYLRLSNVGYYGNRVIIPHSLQCLLIDSDGRPLPESYATDTIEVFPGERFGALLLPLHEMEETIVVQYLNLNTEIVENEQFIDVEIEGYLNIPSIASQDLRIIPNPSSETISFLGNNGLIEGINEIFIYDISGKLIQKTQPNKNDLYTMNIAHLPSGVYFLRILTSDQTLTERFVKP